MRVDFDAILRFNGVDRAPGIPSSTNVCLEPSESARLADWGWAVGLRIRVNGDDEARVMAAFESIVRAGAERVIATWPVWAGPADAALLNMDMGILDSDDRRAA